MSSVLAKLMHIDNPSISHSTHTRRHRVLSENYLQNIASVAKREKVLPLSDDSDLEMDVSEDFHCKTRNYVRTQISSSSSNSLAVDPKLTSDQSKGMPVQRKRLSSSCNGVGSPARSSASSNSSYVDQNRINSVSERSKEMLVREKRLSSFSNGMGSPIQSSTSSNSSSVDQKRRISFSERNKGMLVQEKRLSSFSNGMGSLVRSSASSHEIAKQITGQVMHSVWHSCAELSSSRPRTESSSENKEEIITTLTRSFDSKLKHEESSVGSFKGSISTTTGTQKSKKQFSERWRTRNSSEIVRKSCRSTIRDEVLVSSRSRTTSVTNTSNGSFHTPFYATNINGCVVLGTRYLSKPALFPSAWVPRSRARHFTLDKSWILRQEKMGTEQCNNPKEECKEVESTSQYCICDLDSEKPSSHQEASLILNDSAKLEKQNLCEGKLKPSGSLGNKSEFSDVVSPLFHETQIVLDVNEASHQEQEDFENSAVEALPSNCNLGPFSLEIDEGNEKVKMPTKFRRENLSGDEESFKYELKLKNNVHEPRSPVSSLEGPEDCSHSMNLIVQAAKYLSVSDCFEKDAQGLQKKLRLIETVSLESGSEGPEMMVSSEEGDDDCSARSYENDPQIFELHQTFVQECWDFSYVVDVVVESGLETRNLEIERRRLQLQDYIINPSVFDSLEKKYGKSMPWERSERRLLFDRLSSGLLEIVKPSVGLNTWKQPVSERFLPKDRSQELEEELWLLLVKQQEELKRDKSDMVCRKEIEWLDLEEDTNFIVQELESLVLDEVVEEFVSMEISCF